MKEKNNWKKTFVLHWMERERDRERKMERKKERESSRGTDRQRNSKAE